MGNNGKQWSGRSRGGGFGYNFFILLMKVAGIRSAYAFLSLVVVYFIPFAPRATRAVWFYNRRILGYGRLHSAVKLYAHYYALGQTIIDRWLSAAAWSENTNSNSKTTTLSCACSTAGAGR